MSTREIHETEKLTSECETNYFSCHELLPLHFHRIVARKNNEPHVDSSHPRPQTSEDLEPGRYQVRPMNNSNTCGKLKWKIMSRIMPRLALNSSLDLTYYYAQ